MKTVMMMLMKSHIKMKISRTIKQQKLIMSKTMKPVLTKSRTIKRKKVIMRIMRIMMTMTTMIEIRKAKDLIMMTMEYLLLHRTQLSVI